MVAIQSAVGIYGYWVSWEWIFDLTRRWSNLVNNSSWRTNKYRYWIQQKLNLELRSSPVEQQSGFQRIEEWRFNDCGRFPRYWSLERCSARSKSRGVRWMWSYHHRHSCEDSHSVSSLFVPQLRSSSTSSSQDLMQASVSLTWFAYLFCWLLTVTYVCWLDCIFPIIIISIGIALSVFEKGNLYEDLCYWITVNIIIFYIHSQSWFVGLISVKYSEKLYIIFLTITFK